MLDYGSILDYSDRGFGFVSCTLGSGSQVFFHIKTVKRKYPQLANRLDGGDYLGVSFWYDTETTPKGEQVRELWLEAKEIPDLQLGEVKAGIVRLWHDSRRNLPRQFDRMTRELLGPGEYQKLQAERNRRLHEQRKAEEERRRKAEVEAQHRLAEAARPAAQEAKPTQTSRASSPSGPSAPTQVRAQTDWWFRQLKVLAESNPAAGQGPRQIETRVVGVTHENRQDVIRQLAVGEQVWL